MIVSGLSSTDIKHFSAVCPITKISVNKAYMRATSKTASLFLAEVIKELPFPVHSIQVDGGSEFMGEFELTCKERNIPLYVLPPRSPELNCNVEKDQWPPREKFYDENT